MKRKRIDYKLMGPQIESLGREGLTAKEIAARLDVGRDAIDRYAKQHNLILKDGRGASYRKESFPCVICGTSFHTKKCLYDSGKSTTCSSQCSRIVKSKANKLYSKVQKKCTQCGNTFSRKPSRASKSKFCSANCRIENTRGKPSPFKTSLEAVKSKLPPYLILDDSTFKGIKQKARFIDEEYGEWWTIPTHPLKGISHPLRGRLGLGEKVLSGLKKSGKCNLLPNGQAVKEYCKKFHADSTTAYKIFHRSGPELCQRWIESYERKVTNIELVMQQMLLDLGISVEKYDKQVPVLTKKGIAFRPDFMVNRGRVLYIDVDGLYWHSELFIEKSRHLEKSAAFRDEKLPFVIFREDELDSCPEIVKSIIAHKLGISSKTYYARKLQIRDVNIDDAQTFLAANHLMGTHKTAKYIGLYDGIELISLLGYKKYKDGIDISRFCNKIHTSVVGGLSRLLKEAERRGAPKFIQSFVDLRYGSGDSLMSLGFTLDSVSLGWKWTDGDRTYNRLKCRANMDHRGLSEKEHAKELGWFKIYDAGQAKLIKR